MILVNKLTRAIIKNGIIEEKDKELYIVAIASVMFSLFTWSTLILISIFWKQPWGSVVFLLYFIPLRIYAGGFHHKTRTRCYLHSLAIFLILLIGSDSKLKDWIESYSIEFLLFSCAVILKTAPLETTNKPLNFFEKKHHKIATKVILIMEIVSLLLFKIFDQHEFLYFSVMAILMVTLHLILAMVIQRFKTSRKMH